MDGRVGALAMPALLSVGNLVWLGLGFVTLALLILMRTRWGQSRVLEKCAILSVVMHIVIAGLATWLQIFAPHPRFGPKGDGPDVNFTVADLDFKDDDAPSGQPPLAEPQTLRPWDRFVEPANPSIDRPELPRATTDAPLVRTASANSEIVPPIADVRPAPPTSRPDALTDVRAPNPTNTPTPTPIERPTDAPQSVPQPSPSIQATSPDRLNPAPATADTIRPQTTIGPDVAVSAANVTGVLSNVGAKPTPPTDTEGSGAPRSTAPSAATDIRPQAIPGASGAAAPPASLALRRDGEGTADHAPPPIYQGRTTPDRLGIVKANGGNEDTEAAVRAALLWLVNHQSRDGRWDVRRLEGGKEERIEGHDREGAGIGADTGITGLAVLALLGAGHTHLEGEHRLAVRRGLEFLINSQGADGNLAGDARRFARMYCHAMAAFAVCEAYAMTGDSRLEAPARTAVEYSLRAQHLGGGGWRYQPGDSGDMSQHGWQVLVLKSAELGGIMIPETTRRRAGRFVEACTLGQSNGLASYRPSEAPSRTMTAEAIVCRRFLEMTTTDAAVAEAEKYILAELPGRGGDNFYYWYYATLALQPRQNDAWKQWNRALQARLLQSQRTDGDHAGSWDPDKIWSTYGGRAFSTSLGALCLESYYRFLPTSGRESAKAADLRAR